ncbi:MAG: aminotransferase class I/II-fold pyridoxal phosphate-dependent enzyme [Myxococcota bacterium]|nr:aminotransferase class I/II-fold pyridoxal phosphate-dependent enzyme [Myxococcota bacterium]MDW8362335.1 aminotransferase class I/II-fold pyridoxal phosphate-dependent enzyme [Myxococcales bacterium]
MLPPPMSRPIVDVSSLAAPRPEEPQVVSTMAAGLVGSEILKIAAEIRALLAAGRPVCNLTVGDFDPRQFPIPERLRAAIVDAYAAGETNYPPSNGMPELRAAIQRFYERALGLRYGLDGILVAGGARPVIYATYRALVDPGEAVAYPVPSWNNNHYAHMVGARPVEIDCRPEDRFLPTRDALLPVLSDARLVCLNSPLNPSGTAIARQTLAEICHAILDENARRRRTGRRPLFLMYDQIYWMLTAPGTTHVTPPELEPEMARYTVFVDGISKAFAATGVRVGWAVGPSDVIDRMSALLGHIGAWAPRAEQVATARLLDDAEACEGYVRVLARGIAERLAALHEAIQGMRREGLPVDSLPPEGAIYLTARVHPFGWRTRAGTRLQTNEEVRRFLLEEAGVGLVPFQAFGVRGEGGWFRLSVGAVSQGQIAEAMPRMAAALRSLTPG